MLTNSLRRVTRNTVFPVRQTRIAEFGTRHRRKTGELSGCSRSDGRGWALVDADRIRPSKYAKPFDMFKKLNHTRQDSTPFGLIH